MRGLRSNVRDLDAGHGLPERRPASAPPVRLPQVSGLMRQFHENFLVRNDMFRLKHSGFLFNTLTFNFCRYYQCEDPEGDQLFAVEEHDCGDWIFDPSLYTCVDPDRPGNEGLCPEEAP